MQVSVLLQEKGSEVVTVGPDTPIGEVAEVLASRRIGAAVVTGGDVAVGAVAGVISERDIVAALARHGAEALGRTARDLMSTDVTTCQPDTTLEHLMTTMTNQRVRHVPVVVDGTLAGLVSIGDVVKNHVATLEHEAQAIHDYIANPY